jgi:hemerythrin-like domain-containing protein
MESIETLMAEHRVIEGVLGALITFVEEVVRHASSDRAVLEKFVTFLAEFADGQHHAKEEDILFAEMVRHGFPERSGPIAVMRDDHERGRALVRHLRALAQLPGRWSDEERADLAAAASTYVLHLRAHIQKEDGVLYPLAEQHLPSAAIAEVDLACARADAARAERGAELAALGEELVRRRGGLAAAHPAA